MPPHPQPRPPETVETERLVLRTWRHDDADALGAAVTASLDHLRPWMPWAAGEPLTRTERLGVLAGFARARAADGDTTYGVFLRGTGEVVGGTGLHVRRGPGTLEIGYWIHVDHVRRGYATELAAALTTTALALPGVDHVEIHHDRANAASEGVPRRLGYERVAETPDGATAPGEEGVDVTWRIDAAGWAAARRAQAAGSGA